MFNRKRKKHEKIPTYIGALTEEEISYGYQVTTLHFLVINYNFVKEEEKEGFY
jgi:hypothetical protein